MKIVTKARVTALAWTTTIAVSCGAAQSATVVYNTGTDASNAVQADGTTDTHWTIGSSNLPTYLGTTNGSFPTGPWVLNDPVSLINGSAWITPTVTGSQSFDPPVGPGGTAGTGDFAGSGEL